ncbi:hypothetical protein LTR62_003347 [Meristemomyces frigidus]|uniref:Formyl transferase C-terminal domain-containing protein n=1 Tax=Meristemomyces frigidus TaxID=1508187 RepID=A0AAN7YRT4_9PEZI|nr:hypothetical protein LTR62_003347 [Meristemomyces frigidus]
MKILFLCTAHNSLSQRLYLALAGTHDVSIEYALSDEVMISAVALAQPDIIICPFLTTLVPKVIYENYLTLIIHPGPPGDAGPSSLDYLLLGDDGSVDDVEELLSQLDSKSCMPGRQFWGVTVLQAIEQFDAGPVWAFEQFPIDIDTPGLTKSGFYRGAVTTTAVAATLQAIRRIKDAAISTAHDFAGSAKQYTTQNDPPNTITVSPHLRADSKYGLFSIAENKPFLGGKVHHRPLLKAVARDFDLSRHTAQQISRRIRCADSQPGVLSSVFGPNLYLYGGCIEEDITPSLYPGVDVGRVHILATRNEAVCIRTADGKGIWITHVRPPKTKAKTALCPKVPATLGLEIAGVLDKQDVMRLESPLPVNWSRPKATTFQEVWVDFITDTNGNTSAYLHFDFYNGAMSTNQCSHLVDALSYIIAHHTPKHPIRTVVLMGGVYFSNGIALNVIEEASDPATESWLNINRIDDVVHLLLHEYPKRDILTVAAVRGNAAAGGVALAAACDYVIAGSNAVLNPAYRAIGLYGSEYHTISYYGRCGVARAKHILRAMKPISPPQAQGFGLVDFIFPSGPELDTCIRYHVEMLTKNSELKRGPWKAKVDISSATLARARAIELSEMSKDFWSARSGRYHSRRFDFVRKVKARQTPLRFATHRRVQNGVTYHDEEELDSFDDVSYYEALPKRLTSDALRAEVRGETGFMVAKWVEEEQMERGHRRESVALEMEQVTANIALPGVERRAETVFSCYYKPVDGPLTPPTSPDC